MISAQFFMTPQGALLGFSIEGHSGFAESGGDIVCAAVSSAAYMATNTVTEVLQISPLSLIAVDGDMLLRIDEKDAVVCRDILLGLKLHLTSLEEQYEDNLKVNYLEV